MTIIIFLTILAVLVLVHELGHFLAAKNSGIRVDEFGVGFPPRLFSWKPKNGETRYSINIIPFGGFVKIFGEDPNEASISGPDSNRSFVNKSRLIQAWVLSAGVIFNVIFAWLLITIGFIIGLPTIIDDTNREYARDISLTITQVLPDSPAEEIGLRPGDKILSLNNSKIITAEEVSEIISRSFGKEMEMVYRRGEQEFLITSLVAVEGIVEDQIAVGIVMDRIGLVSFPLSRAIIEGTKTTWNLLVAVTVGLSSFISDAFTGDANLSQVSGPVGIVGLVGEASELGLIYLLSFTALISLHLAILNLVPFPALDGGRILFVIIESIIRRPINPRVQNWLNGLGFVLLITLMLVVTYNDVIKLF